MKTLTLLRHAKSGWDDPVARDFDRPLNAKGKRVARAIGGWLRTQKLCFDAVVASPALRVTETLDAAGDGYGRTFRPEFDKRIYLAAGETLLEVVRQADDARERLLLVGHNPGLEELILLLVPDDGVDAARDQIVDKFPTASVASLALDVAHWADVAPGAARIAVFVRPRDLDPAFGPDAA